VTASGGGAFGGVTVVSTAGGQLKPANVGNKLRNDKFTGFRGVMEYVTVTVELI